jgi:hypothetical protein
VKTLFIVKQEPDETIKTIMAETTKISEVTFIDFRDEQNYDTLVDTIEKCDRVITW